MSWRWRDEDWGSAGGQGGWGSDPDAVPLALKGDQESLLLEGLPGTPQPHRLPLAGTTFQLRQGPDQTQSLEALGPINASLIVMVTIVGARCRKTLASLAGNGAWLPLDGPLPHLRYWPGQSWLPSATASMRPSPEMRCPPTPGTTRPGPSARPSVPAVRSGWGQGWALVPWADLLVPAGLSGSLAHPQAARCRPWSAAISWTARPWPPTIAAPTANCPRDSEPATRSPARQSECLPGLQGQGDKSRSARAPQGGVRALLEWESEP